MSSLAQDPHRRLGAQAVSPPRVIEVDPGTDSRWDAFVLAHPDGLIYHHSLWLKVIETSYRYQPVCLAFEGADGSFQGVLPLFRASGLLTGRCLSSLPHTPVAGPLAWTDDVVAALVVAAMDRIDLESGTWLQLKCPAVWREGHAKGLVGLPARRTYVLELPNRAQDLRFGNSRNHGRIRWSLRKASRQHLEVRLAETDSDLGAWYRLYLHTMRRLVVLPRPFRFFEAAWHLLRPAGFLRLLLVEQRSAGSSRLIAGSILLMSGRTVFYAFNGWSREDLGQRANDAIQWRAIHDAWLEGYRRYDLGEVDEYDRGLAEFKSKWGGECNRLHRYYYPAPSGLESRVLGSRPAQTQLLATAWRWLPLKVTAMLGDHVHRVA